MSNRATGRTFRACMAALEAASAGKKVVYYTLTKNASQYAYVAAMDIAHKYADGCSSRERRIRFAGGGTVEFLCGDQLDFRGRSVDLVVHDDIRD